MSKTSTIFSRLHPDGTLVRVNPDGTEEPVTIPTPAAMSEDAVEAAAFRNPDARPLTQADLARMKRVPRIRSLRRALGLTQEEFAARYHVSLGTLRD